MPAARSVNRCSPPPLQPLLTLGFTSCAAGKRGAGGAVPGCQPPCSHSSHHSSGSRGAARAPRPLRRDRAQPRCRDSPVPALRSRGARRRWEEADAPLAKPTRSISRADAGACSKAAPARVGKHINYRLFSQGCPFLCRNRCLA